MMHYWSLVHVVGFLFFHLGVIVSADGRDHQPATVAGNSDHQIPITTDVDDHKISTVSVGDDGQITTVPSDQIPVLSNNSDYKTRTVLALGSRLLANDHLVNCAACTDRHLDCVIDSSDVNASSNASDFTVNQFGSRTHDLCQNGNFTVLDECVACIRRANETCGGPDQSGGICQAGSACWPIAPSKGRWLNGSEMGVCVELLDHSCETPIESKGCNVYAKQGCVCSTVIACRPVEFQYSDEDECHEDWRKLKGMWKEDCLKARCSVIFQPHCPPDSVFVPASPPEPPECCQKPGSCQCSLTSCGSMHDALKSCPSDQELILAKKGTGEPGACCDIYECHSRESVECSDVICPPLDVGINEANNVDGARKDDDCPEDSFRPLTTATKNTCCPVKDECRCRPGLCKPANCPQGLHAVVRKKGAGVPGACCDHFECVDQQETVTARRLSMCDYDGRMFEVGDVWRPSPCTECTCKDGVSVCRKLECPPSTCTRMVIPDGECCPVCIGCVSEEGEVHNVTDEWQKDDCTSCSCEEGGRVVCQKQMCKIECDHPVKVPGECCPKCDRPLIITLSQMCPRIELCTLRCEYGFRRDDRGCFICECQTDHSAPDHAHTSTIGPLSPVQSVRRNCSLFDGGSCSKKCAHGYDHDVHGCPMCKCKVCPPFHQCYKHCLYGFQTNVYECGICKCKGESDRDPLISSSSERIPGLYDHSPRLDLAGCNSMLGGTREHGEWWFDGCRHCYCDNGLEYCSILSCPPLNCTDPVYDVGDCCPTCPGSSQEGLVQRLLCHDPGSGRSYVEGEYWNLEPCVRCTCHVGHVLCNKKLCPPTPCQNSSMPEGKCCPVCENLRVPELGTLSNGTICQSDTSDIASIAHMDGSIWRTSPCDSCICQNGREICYKQPCPWNGCAGRMLQLKHECCPICTANIENGACRFSDSVVYSVSEQWRDGPCRNCSCVGDGETLCTQVECPRCTNATPVEGQCCPLCPDDDVPVIAANGGRNTEWRSWTTVTPSTVGTRLPELPGASNDGPPMGLLLFSCVAGVLAVLLIVLVIIFVYRKSTRHRSQHQDGLFSFLRRNKKGTGARLTNFPGYDPSKSVPTIEKRSTCHEQMKTLLDNDCITTNGDIMKANVNGNISKMNSNRHRPDILLTGHEADRNCNNNTYDERNSEAVKTGTLLYDYDIDHWDVEKV